MPPVHLSGCRHVSRVATQITNKRNLLKQQAAEAHAAAGRARRQLDSEAGSAIEGGAGPSVAADGGGAAGEGTAAAGSEQQQQQQEAPGGEQQHREDGQEQGGQQQQPPAKRQRLEMPSAAEWAKAEEWRESKGRSKEIYECARTGKLHPDWVTVGGCAHSD